MKWKVGKNILEIYLITEKIHGANHSVCFGENQINFFSRNQKLQENFFNHEKLTVPATDKIIQLCKDYLRRTLWRKSTKTINI
jgi:hypothetical protein